MKRKVGIDMNNEKVGKKMLVWILIYVCCSALGLVMIKMGINQSFKFSVSNQIIELRFGLKLILGFILYVTSFLLSMLVLSKFDLNYFYPVSAGLIYVLVCILSVALLKEVLSKNAMIGMVLIFAGVIFMNLPGKK